MASAPDPGPVLFIAMFAASVVPAFLASWKRPALGSAAVFMSVFGAMLAINGNAVTGDLVYGVIWTGAMLIAALSRVLDVLDGLPTRIADCFEDADHSVASSDRNQGA